jgi:hypothetical protein
MDNTKNLSIKNPNSMITYDEINELLKNNFYLEEEAEFITTAMIDKINNKTKTINIVKKYPRLYKFMPDCHKTKIITDYVLEQCSDMYQFVPINKKTLKNTAKAVIANPEMSKHIPKGFITLKKNVF